MLYSLFASALLFAASSQALPGALDERAVAPIKTCTRSQYLLKGKCVPCTSTFKDAATCNSAGALTCSTKFLDKATKRCVSACPTGFYGKNKLCSTCPYGSTTCTATAATACHSPFFLAEGKCKPSCAAGTFGSTTGSRACTSCSKVNINAATCNSTQALSCKSGSKLYKGKCYKTCPSATFAESTDKTCIDCPAHALACTSSSVSTCEEGFTAANTTCSPESKAYYRIPDALSKFSDPHYISWKARTEKQCVNFCASFGDVYMRFYSYSDTTECTCHEATPLDFRSSGHDSAMVTIMDVSGSPCSAYRERFGPDLACELVVYRDDVCYVKGTNDVCAVSAIL